MRKAEGKKRGNGDPESAKRGIGDVFGNVLETVSGGIAKAAGDTDKVGPLFLEAVADDQRAVSGRSIPGTFSFTCPKNPWSVIDDLVSRF